MPDLVAFETWKFYLLLIVLCLNSVIGRALAAVLVAKCMKKDMAMQTIPLVLRPSLLQQQLRRFKALRKPASIITPTISGAEQVRTTNPS